MSCSCTNNSTVLPVGSPGADGTDGSNGSFGGFSGKWVFSTSTSAGPSSTQLRLNNATYNSVTNIYISDTNADSVSYDAFLDQLDNNSNFGLIRIFKEFDNTKFWLGQITSVTDNGTDHTIGVTYISHNSSFSASDNLVLSFAPSGLIIDTDSGIKSWNSSSTLTAGTDKSIIILTSADGFITTTNRVITLQESTGNNNFKLILLQGLSVGTGFTWKVKDSGGTDLLTLTEGYQAERAFEFYWNGSSYNTGLEVPTTLGENGNNNGYPIGEKKILRAEYDFAVDGGSIGTINLSEVLPSNSIIDIDNITIYTVTPLVSGGSATVSIGITAGAVDAFDTLRAYNKYPYATPTGSSRVDSYGTTSASNTPTINKKRGGFTTAALTTAAGASTDLTLTNYFINTTSNVNVTIGNYSGTLTTNGIPIAYSKENAGTLTIKIHNAHATNALNGTLDIKFNVVDNNNSLTNVVYLPVPSSISITIATATLTAGKFYIYIPYQIFG